MESFPYWELILGVFIVVFGSCAALFFAVYHFFLKAIWDKIREPVINVDIINEKLDKVSLQSSTMHGMLKEHTKRVDGIERQIALYVKQSMNRQENCEGRFTEIFNRINRLEGNGKKGKKIENKGNGGQYKGKCLIVDDEENVREALLLHMEDLGYSCATAASYDETIDKFAEKRFDVALIDIQLKCSGEQNGINLWRFISKKYPLTKAVIYSGYEQNSLPADIRFIHKRDIFKKIEHHLKNWDNI